ncbi:hypothetical protein D3C80_1958720 [compost metagenome]
MPVLADTAAATFSTEACSRCCDLCARRLVMPKARSLESSCSSAASSGLICRMSGAYRYSRPKVRSWSRSRSGRQITP